MYKSYVELEVWQETRKLAKITYDITKIFLKEERFGLISQMRRCIVSVSSNIAEGIGRQRKLDTIHFLHIARGSLYELETQYYLAYDLSFIILEQLDDILNKNKVCKKIIKRIYKIF